MRKIGSVANQAASQVFVDYLYSIGIEANADVENDGTWSIWILAEKDLERGHEELQLFLVDPGHARYRAAVGVAQEKRKQELEAQKRREKNHIDIRQRWSRSLSQRAPVTVALIAICVLVAFLTRLGNSQPYTDYFLIASNYYDANAGPAPSVQSLPEVRKGQVWRLLSPIFLHFTLLHIFFNMYLLLIFGQMVETLKGTKTLVAFVLAMGVFSNLVQLYGEGNHLFGGMSGVVYGLFGYVWMKSKFEPSSGFFVHPHTIFMLMFWFFFALFGGIGNIANLAHAGGLAMGLFLGYWRTFRQRLS